MKQKLKGLSFILAMLFVANAAFSQSQFGIRAGVNFSNLNGKAGGNKIEDTKLLPGFNVGVTYDVNLADEFYLQPGLLFTTKGAKGDLSFGEASLEDMKMTLNYLELPINFLYKPELGEGNLILGVGPYVAYGLGGKAKFGSFSNDIKFGKDEDFKAFDYGGNLLFGYQLPSGISFQLNAQLGMGNMIHDGDSDNSLRNTQFGISLGYKF